MDKIESRKAEVTVRVHRGLAADLAKVWNELDNKSDISSFWMGVQLKDKYKRQDISSVLCKYVRKGYAQKNNRTPGSYIKLRNSQPSEAKRIPKEARLPTMDALALGRGIIGLIDHYNSRVTDLRQKLIEERQVVRTLVEQRKELEVLVAKAHTRILELSNHRE